MDRCFSLVKKPNPQLPTRPPFVVDRPWPWRMQQNPRWGCLWHFAKAARAQELFLAKYRFPLRACIPVRCILDGTRAHNSESRKSSRLVLCPAFTNRSHKEASSHSRPPPFLLCRYAPELQRPRAGYGVGWIRYDCGRFLYCQPGSLPGAGPAGDVADRHQRCSGEYTWSPISIFGQKLAACQNKSKPRLETLYFIPVWKNSF